MLLRLALRVLRQQVQVDENLDFRPQNLRDDGGRYVIDGAERVCLGGVQLVAIVGGDEDDGYVRRSAAATDQGRGLETVQAGHVDIQQDGRKVPIEHLLQRLLTGSGGEQGLTDILHNGLVDKQLIRPIVDDQDIGLPAADVPILVVV